jgi:hypothetical protein
MPFTVSHIAAVLPAHRPLSRLHLFTAAVIGSMAPDFGMLVPGEVSRWQSHSISALFTFCLPWGMAVYVLTVLLIKPALREIAPDGAYARLRDADSRAPPLSLRHWLLAAVVILLAAVTHLVWDGFTHENARGVRMFPILAAYGPGVEGHALRLWSWLQYGSSVVGLAVVVCALLLWLRHSPAPTAPLQRALGLTERRLWFAAYFVLPLVGLCFSLWHLQQSPLITWALGAKIERVASSGMRTSSVSLALVSLLVLLRLRLLGARQPSRPQGARP